MKTQRFIVEIEMPEGDMVSSGWLKDLIQEDCDVEDAGRQKVVVREVQLPDVLDEAANHYAINIRLGYPRVMDETDKYIFNAFKSGAKWMAEQGVTLNLSIDELSCGAYNSCVEQGLTNYSNPKEMKTNDLMIGDLVRVAKDVCIKKGTIVKVRSIDGDNSFPEKGLKGCATCEPIDDRTLSGGVWVEYLEPIPLTPEILEKNGFLYDDIIPFEQRWQQFGLSIYGTPGNYHINCGINVSMDVSNVHQLQHALKFCGIDKEIKL